MKRHILDHPRPEVVTNRLPAYLAIERQDGELHPATRALHSRPVTVPIKSAALTQFLRIERGKQA